VAAKCAAGWTAAGALNDTPTEIESWLKIELSEAGKGSTMGEAVSSRCYCYYYTHTQTHTRISLLLSLSISIHIYIHIYLYTNTHTHTHTYIYIYIYIYINTFVGGESDGNRKLAQNGIERGWKAKYSGGRPWVSKACAVGATATITHTYTHTSLSLYINK